MEEPISSTPSEEPAQISIPTAVKEWLRGITEAEDLIEALKILCASDIYVGAAHIIVNIILTASERPFSILPPGSRPISCIVSSSKERHHIIFRAATERNEDIFCIAIEIQGYGRRKRPLLRPCGMNETMALTAKLYGEEHIKL
ncbi:MAG: hypothetical protein QXW41_09260 [Fervidicoccaceae archaeon]